MTVEVERIVEKIVEVDRILEKIVEVSKEVIVEVPVERIAKVEVPVEVERIVERVVEKRVVMPVEVERIVERIVEVPVEKIVERRVEVPVEVEKIVEVNVDRIVERIVEVPVDRIIERRVEVPIEVEKIVERIVEVQVERIVEKRVEVPIEVERIVEVPVERLVEKLTEVSIEDTISRVSELESNHEGVEGRNNPASSDASPSLETLATVPDAKYDFLKAPPRTGTYGSKAVHRVADNSGGEAIAGLTVKYEREPDGATEGLDGTRPPTLDPPPSLIMTPPADTTKMALTGPPPRPQSPPPDELVVRATTPIGGTYRRSQRPAKSATGTATRAVNGETIPRPRTASRQVSMNNFAQANPAQSTPVKQDDPARFKTRTIAKGSAPHNANSGYVSAGSSISGHHSHASASSLGALPAVPSAPRATSHGSTNPATVYAVTQTVIGEYLHKYTRRAIGKGQSGNRHQRFFWIHPWTRTLYWSTADPGSDTATESSAKSVLISSVRAIDDTNIQPLGLFSKSIIVATRGRDIQFTAPTKDRHDLWMSVSGSLRHASGLLILYLGSRISSAATNPSVIDRQLW